MLVATIRPVEIRTVDVEGGSLADIQAQLRAVLPAGFELASAPVVMSKSSSTMTATGTLARRDGLKEIEADTMAGIAALTPEGWQVLSVRGL